MKKIIPLFLFLLVCNQVVAQYTTPGTGVDWTLDDIVTASPGTVTVSGNVYTLHQNLTVAANDILRINSDLTLKIDGGIRVTVFGSFFVTADEVIITATDSSQPFDGFRFEELSDINIQNSTIEYGGGLQVLTETFTLNNCTVRFQNSGVATGGAITLSRGIPVISNSTFMNNLNPAISSAANANVSPQIFGNHIEANNQTNNNRPQINLGPSRANDTLRIVNNTIIGDRDLIMAGGIALANLTGGSLLAVVVGNTIQDNRYGITIIGPTIFVGIKNNIIEDNDTQGDPMQGGSGINLNAPTGGQTVFVSENQIRRNLWGITIQGPVDANLGDDANNPGGNVFADNGNNGEVFAMYNNGLNTILAKHNCWIEGVEITLEEAEEVIFHKVDDPSLGEVIFDPVCQFVAVDEFDFDSFVLYPNPTQDAVWFDNSFGFEKLYIRDLSGKTVYKSLLIPGTNKIEFILPSGLYFTEFAISGKSVVRKLVVK